MAIDYQQVVRPLPHPELNSVALDARAGFLLSRIDKAMTIELLCQISGMPEQETLSIVLGLVEKGLVEIDGDLHAIQQSLGCATQPAVQKSDKSAESANNNEPISPRDHGSIDLPPELIQRLDDLSGRINDMNFFELLEVDTGADSKTIRRAYFQLSKVFHPDRYYGKDLGPYKDILARIFAEIRTAYAALKDDKQRAEYATLVQSEKVAAIGETESKEKTPFSDTKTTATHRAVRSAASSFRRQWLKKTVRTTSSVAKADATTAEQLVVTKALDETSADLDSDTFSSSYRENEADRRRDDRTRRRRFTSGVHSAIAQRRRGLHFFEQGMKQLEDGKSLAALASFRLALSFDGDNSEYQRHYDKLVEATRGDVAANHYKRAEFERSVGRFEAAEKLYKRAIDADPQTRYFIGATKSALSRGDLATAESYARSGVDADTNSAGARLCLASVLFERGAKDAALREVAMAKRIGIDEQNTQGVFKELKDRWNV